MKAWKEWIERDKQGRLENARRLEKQQKMTQCWELVRTCREMIRENYSSWQERRVTGEEKRKLQEIEQEKLGMLEKVKGKKLL